MANIPQSVASVMRAADTLAPVSLLELQCISGRRLFLSDADSLTLPAVLTTFDAGGLTAQPFLSWLTEAPVFKHTGTLSTPTSSASFQNTGTNTVQRDGTLLFSKEELWGAIFVFRLWCIEAEYALTTDIGNVSDVDVDDDTVELQLKSASNWSEIKAPDCEINDSCQNVFGSQQCGSTSPVPCQNTFGSCTQTVRFKGFVSTWNTANLAVPSAATAAVAQPAPFVQINLRRPA